MPAIHFHAGISRSRGVEISRDLIPRPKGNCASCTDGTIAVAVLVAALGHLQFKWPDSLRLRSRVDSARPGQYNCAVAIRRAECEDMWKLFQFINKNKVNAAERRPSPLSGIEVNASPPPVLTVPGPGHERCPARKRAIWITATAGLFILLTYSVQVITNPISQ